MEETIPTLIGRVGDRDGLVQERARHTQVRQRRAYRPALIDLLDSPTKHLRWEAAKALAAIGDPSSVSALTGLLGDKESDVRWVGGEGLIEMWPRSLPNV